MSEKTNDVVKQGFFDKLLGIGTRSNVKETPKNVYRYDKPVSKEFEITETTPTRIEPTVDAFVSAREGAVSKIIQSRNILYDLYTATLDIDGYAYALIEKRLDNIGNKSVVLIRDGEILSQYNDFFQSPKFSAFLKDIIMVQFWGMGLFEFHKDTHRDKDWFDYFKIPIKHINPYSQEILKNQMDSKGESYKDVDNVMFLGDSDDLGILNRVTLLSIYKRLAYSDYARYSELASENFTVSTYRTTDMDNIKRIEDSVSNKGRGGVLSVPEGVNVRQENQSSSQQNELFRDYNKMLKEDLAILILGQTMTTADGSSRAQASVHQEEQDSKFTKDEKYVLNALNYNFLDYLPIWNIPVTPDTRFSFEVNTDKEVSKRIAQLKQLKELGVEFNDAELREKFKDIV